MNNHRREYFSHQDKPTHEGKPFFRRKKEVCKKSNKKKRERKENMFIRKSSKEDMKKIHSKKGYTYDTFSSQKG